MENELLKKITIAYRILASAKSSYAYVNYLNFKAQQDEIVIINNSRLKPFMGAES